MKILWTSMKFCQNIQTNTQAERFDQMLDAAVRGSAWTSELTEIKKKW